MSFLIKDEKVGEQYKQIWGVIKNKLDIKFHSKSICETKYLKTKIREYDCLIKTNFLDKVINLHFSSSHPFSLGKDFTCHTEEMKSWFLNKGYPKWLINQEKGKVNFFNSIVSRRVKANFKEVFLWLFTTHYSKHLVKLPINIQNLL